MRDDHQIIGRQVGTFRFAGSATLENKLHDPFRGQATGNRADIVVQLRTEVSRFEIIILQYGRTYNYSRTVYASYCGVAKIIRLGAPGA